MLRITAAQINPTIGDMTGNVTAMLSAAHAAESQGAHVVVFPELSLTGYHPGDLLDDLHFRARITDGLSLLLQKSRETPKLHWVFGMPALRVGPGKPFVNRLLVVKDGAVLDQLDKQLLPNENVCNEARHFEPGPAATLLVHVENTAIGFLVSDDAWHDASVGTHKNPWLALADRAPDLVVCINASASSAGMHERRLELFSSTCARHKLPLLLVNQVGGHDQLVYDGASFAVHANGCVVAQAPSFESSLMTLDFDPASRAFCGPNKEVLATVFADALPVAEFYRRQIVLGLQDYARRCGFTQVVVGCSGGLDSALTIALAVQALGADNVIAITMPSEYSSEGSVSDSVALCSNLGVRLIEHPIKEVVVAFEKSFSAAIRQPLRGLAQENLQARARGTILMEFSNTFGHLLLSTGNKSESAVGYCTLYGDTNGGLNLIGDLYKTEVFELSRHINAIAGRELIPESIINKPPSAELAPDQKDTDSLPPYEVLDEVLKQLIEGDTLSQLESEHAADVVTKLLSTAAGKETFARIRRLIANSEFKRHQMPPALRMRARAFGPGRQVPIAAVKY